MTLFELLLRLWPVFLFIITGFTSLAWWLIKLGFKVNRLEDDLTKAEYNISELDKTLDAEIKSIQASINQINSTLQRLEDMVKMIAEGKINIPNR